MRATPLAVILLLGCGGGSGRGADPKPPAATRAAPGATATEAVPARALPGPLGLDEAIRTDLRHQNDEAKARREQIDRMFEAK